jgi:Protein of unknown function (DUF2911)
MRNKSLAMIGIVLALGLSVAAQQTPPDKSKRPSPPGTADCKFGDGKTIHTDYSRPYMKGRQIYGGLVPYAKVWRTGANEATTFVTDTDVTINGTAVPKGSYTIFTLPAEAPAKWKLIINKATGEWGVGKDGSYPYESTELGRADMNASTKLDAPVEQFTLSYVNKGKDTCTLQLDWANTRVTAEVKEKK